MLLQPTDRYKDKPQSGLSVLAIAPSGYFSNTKDSYSRSLHCCISSGDVLLIKIPILGTMYCATEFLVYLYIK
jgi:hypothetical protein